MSRLVTVEVEGLSFCYIKNSRWHVTFVCDELHDLWFTPPQARRRRLRRETHDLILQFEGAVEPQKAPAFPREGLPNASADYAHGVDANGNSNLDFCRGSEFDTCVLDMELPECTLELGSMRWSKRWFQEVKPQGGGDKKEVGKVTKKVTFSFLLKSNNARALKVRVTDLTANSIVYDDEFPATVIPGDLTFKFNNDCGQRCRTNDSLHMYDIYTDRNDPTKRFVIGRLIDGEVPGNGSKKSREIIERSPTYGNCDPTGGQPPPGGDWPPTKK